MITMYRIYMYLLAACLLLGVTACEEEGLGNEETPFAPLCTQPGYQFQWDYHLLCGYCTRIDVRNNQRGGQRYRAKRIS